MWIYSGVSKYYPRLSSNARVMLFDWHCPLTARRSSSSPRDSLIRFCLVCLHLSFPLTSTVWSEPKCVKAVIRSQIVVLLCLLCFAVCAQMFLFFFPQTHSARVSSKAKRANNSTSERQIKGLLLSHLCVCGRFLTGKESGGVTSLSASFILCFWGKC